MSLRVPRAWAQLAFIGSLAMGVVTRPSIVRLIHGGLPRFPYLCAPLSPAAYDALAARPSWAKTSLSVEPGISLKGLVRRPKASDAPWVLFFPGNDESQLTAGQDMLERLAAARDWGLIVYANRGYDSSDGKPSADALREDGYRILQGALAAEHVEPKRLHVVAFSMGGYVAAAAVGRAAREHTPVASLSTLAAVEKMEMVHSLPLSRFVMGDIFDTMPLLDDVPAPVLVQHGTADTTLNVSQGRAIAGKLGARATFRELPGVGHHDILRNEDALAAVRSFVEANARH